MSTLKSDAVTATTTNGDLVISGNGTGVPDIETGFKVGGTAGLPINNLRVGTDGELITWDASGDPATVAVGTATHLLTSNGAGAAPTFQAAAAGGAWTLIGTSTASDSASLTQTGLDSSTYNTFAVALTDIVPATDGEAMGVRVGDSSGVDSGASDYYWNYAIQPENDNAYGGTANAGDNIIDMGHSTGNATGEGLSALFYIQNLTRQTVVHGSYCLVDQATTLIGGHFVGQRRAVITVDRVLIQFSSGNITSGRMTVWGIAHA
jgi:hypothetical protein